FLTLCIETDISSLFNKAYKVLKNFSRSLIVVPCCNQIKILIYHLQETLCGCYRNKIIPALMIITNLAMLECEESINPFNIFDLGCIIELLCLMDDNITLCSLYALQVLTLKTSLKTSFLSTYISSIVLFVTSENLNDFFAPPIDDVFSNKKTLKITITNDVKIRLNEWVEKKYEKTNDLSNAVLLHSVFVELKHEYNENPYFNQYLLALLKMFQNYTPLLYETVESLLVANEIEKIDVILQKTTNFIIPYFDINAGPLESRHFLSYPDDGLRNLQICRLFRLYGRYNFNPFIYNQTNELKETQTMENTNLTELVQVEIKSNSPLIEKTSPIPIEYSLAAARVLSNICQCNVSFKR
ncbi:hypothetical protein HZS_5137, partial [Henneguya salminicola]